MKWKYETYRKLYCREEGSFARLPLYARALAGELLKITDDQGRIFVGSDALEAVVAFRLGATRADRRALKEHIPLLVADGYLVKRGDYYAIKNFAQAQRTDHEPATNEPPSSNERTTTEPRSDHEATTTVQRTSNEPTTKLDPSNENHSGQSGYSFLPSVPSFLPEKTPEPPPPVLPRPTMAAVGAVTPAFLRVYDRYAAKVRGDGKQKAAQFWQTQAAMHPSGETGLEAEITAAFKAGMLNRSPYSSSDLEGRPFLSTVLAETRWRDAPPPKQPARETTADFCGKCHVKPCRCAKDAEERRIMRGNREGDPASSADVLKAMGVG